MDSDGLLPYITVLNSELDGHCIACPPMDPPPMSHRDDFGFHSPAGRKSFAPMGTWWALTLLCEISVPLTYFGLVSFVVLIGPQGPTDWTFFSAYAIPAALYCLSLWGVGLYVCRVILCRSLVKWFLVAVSILGVLLLPIALWTGLDWKLVIPPSMPYYLAGWSVLLLATTRAAFHCGEARLPDDPDAHEDILDEDGIRFI